MRLRVLGVLGVLALLCGGCGDDDGPSPDGGGPDGGPPDTAADVPLPPGVQGDILRVPESASFAIPGLSAPVYVVRTEADIPHVYAQNERDLRIVQAHISMRDRYFTFEAGRRLALGKLSGLLGDAGLASDVDSRSRGLTSVAQRLLDTLSPEDEEMFDAFVTGINAYVRDVKENRVSAPSLLRIAAPVLGARRPGELMEEVTRLDVAAFGATLIYQGGYGTLDVEREDAESRMTDALFAGALEEARRRDGVRLDIWGDVSPVHDVTSTPGFGLEMGGSATGAIRLPPLVPAAPDGAGRRLPTLPRDMLERLQRRNDRLESRWRGGRDADFGSNEWAVAGSGTVDGAALLAGDGHLQLTAPPLFYQLGLDTTVFGTPEGRTQLGLFFAGPTPMGVGTNGKIAWTQTFLDADVTDWYAEEVVLDAAGKPTATRFRGADRPLVTVDEVYDIRNVPALGSVGRTETWTRFETFDGRRLAAIEGRAATADTVPGAGETLVNILGDFVIPEDTNGDGVVSGISFDYTGLDASSLVGAFRGFGDSETVDDFRAAQRRVVGFVSNLAAADTNGDIYYSGYNAIPCRTYLPRDGEGHFMPGADPTRLIDGTLYGGFEVPLDAEGFPDEAPGATDPQKCLVPFDQFPASRTPDRGYVANANNSIEGAVLDGRLDDDAWYIGGPYAPGYRALTITETLASEAAAKTASVESMAALQASHRSRVGQQLGPVLLAAVARAAALADGAGPTSATEQQLLDAYLVDRAGVDAAATRLSGWLSRGADAASGVETFYDSVEGSEADDAVATMIFATFFRRLFEDVFGDEGIPWLWRSDPRFLRMVAITRILDGRGAGNPLGLASWSPDTEESVFFDKLGTSEVESSDEILVEALAEALVELRAEPDPETPGVGGFGTTDMSQWLWGLRHMVALESLLVTFAGDTEGVDLLAGGFNINPERLPLMESLPDDDPRASLPWFPRPGDFFAVDAANPSFSVGNDYFYRNGPVFRMVIRVAEGDISGLNVLPGGQSDDKGSEHFDDQAAMWLGNQALPFRYHVEDVLEGAVHRETYLPE